MNYRTLGKTGLKISEVGIGTWQLAGQPWGWDKPDEEESLRALDKFIELGGNFIDTAYVYGRSDGNKVEKRHSSEELIGKFLREKGIRDKVVVASKIPGKNSIWPALRNVPAEEVFPKDHIIKITNESLKNLGVDAIDLMQFHVWQDDFVNNDDWKEAIQQLTKEGKVRFWGISINDYQPSNCLKTLDTGLIDSIQFIFNIFHQKPKEKLLPYAREHNIGLIARVPFDEGSLTGKITEDTKWENGELKNAFFGLPGSDRRKEILDHTESLKMLFGEEVSTLPELALKFILSHSEVSTVIPGMSKVPHALDNVKVSDGKKLSKDLMNELSKHKWERNFYPDSDPSMKDDGFIEV